MDIILNKPQIQQKQEIPHSEENQYKVEKLRNTDFLKPKQQNLKLIILSLLFCTMLPAN